MAKKSTSRKRKTTARKVARMPRGGFVSSGYSAAFTRAAKTLAGDVAGMAAKDILGKSPGLMSAMKSIDRATSKAKRLTRGATKVGEAILGIDQTSKIVNHGLKFPTVQMDSEKRAGNMQVQQIRTLKTKAVLGKPSTSTLLRAARQNGKEENLLHSTIHDDQLSTGIDALARIGLNQRFGFNMKQWYFPNQRAYMTIGDVGNQFISKNSGPSDLKTSSFNDYTLLGGLLYEKIKFRISNSSSYFPIKFKVHIMACESVDKLTSNIFNEMFNTFIDTQQDGRIPVLRQLVDADTSGYYSTCWTDPGVTMSMADRFWRDNDVVKTFSKRLRPGDVWELEYYVQCGAGVDLEKASAAKGSAPNAPLNFYPIIEAQGLQCEIVKSSDLSTYIGTSPGYWNLEMEKSFCAARSSASKEIVDISSEQLVPGNYLIRPFSKVKENPVRIFNVNTSNIGNPATQPYFVPVAGGEQPQFAENIGQRVKDEELEDATPTAIQLTLNQN